MTSIPKHRNRYKVAEAKQQMVDKIGTDKVEFELEDGTVYELPHPLFYSSDIKKALKPLDDDDTEGVFRVLMGDDQFDEFVAHGGDPEDLQFVMMQVSEDTTATLAGRKRPTRS